MSGRQTNKSSTTKKINNKKTIVRGGETMAPCATDVSRYSSRIAAKRKRGTIRTEGEKRLPCWKKQNAKQPTERPIPDLGLTTTGIQRHAGLQGDVNVTSRKKVIINLERWQSVLWPPWNRFALTKTVLKTPIWPLVNNTATTPRHSSPHERRELPGVYGVGTLGQ